VDDSSAHMVFPLQLEEDLSEIGLYFVELTLWNGSSILSESGNNNNNLPSGLLSKNIYWLASESRAKKHSSSLFSPLKNLLPPKISVSPRLLFIESPSRPSAKYCVKLSISNDFQPSNALFSLRFMVRKTEPYMNSSRILPVYYEDNYITMMPHRYKTLSLYFETDPSNSPTIWMEAFNLPPQMVISYKSGQTTSDWQLLPEWEANQKRQCFIDNPHSPLKCCYGDSQNE